MERYKPGREGQPSPEDRLATTVRTLEESIAAIIDGEPLPEPPQTQEIREATAAGTALYQALETYVTAQGISVMREELTHGNGYYAPMRRQIAIHNRLSGDQATKTMAHETAHFVVDHRGGIAREDAETVAESVAYVVLGHYDIDSGDYRFAYVARWAEDRQVLNVVNPKYRTVV